MHNTSLNLSLKPIISFANIMLGCMEKRDLYCIFAVYLDKIYITYDKSF